MLLAYCCVYETWLRITGRDSGAGGDELSESSMVPWFLQIAFYRSFGAYAKVAGGEIGVTFPNL